MTEQKEKGVILGVANALVDLADLSAIGPLVTVAGGLHEYTKWGFTIIFKAGGVLDFQSGDRRDVISWHQRIKHAWGSLNGYGYYEGVEIAPLIAMPTPDVEFKDRLSDPSLSISPESQERSQIAPIQGVDPASQETAQSGQEAESHSPYTLLGSRGRKGS